VLLLVPFWDLVAAWRVALAARIRSGPVYQIMYKLPRIGRWIFTTRRPSSQRNNFNLQQDPSHPLIFSILREAIIREENGFVHPDMGFLVPAPCGAARGVGLVSWDYHECQTRCYPGIADEKEKYKDRTNLDFVTSLEDPIYMQEEILIRLPLSYQMTRGGALSTLTPLLPADIRVQNPLDDLDDAALLTLYLAHERGLSRESKWLPYIASLPKEPSCGYNVRMRPFLLNSLKIYSEFIGLEVQGWPAELEKASQYADRIVTALARDYGSYLRHPPDIPPVDNLQWALCHVASRATAGSERHGSLRLLPLLDQLNHDVASASFVELTGTERFDDGDFLDTEEQDSGTFVVRSLRHGRRRALKVRQELTINYNVPHYSPLDWFLQLGFVPPERWKPWVKIDPVLPRVRKDGPFDPEQESIKDEWIKKPTK
jgi:hypothetical protein